MQPLGLQQRAGSHLGNADHGQTECHPPEQSMSFVSHDTKWQLEQTE